MKNIQFYHSCPDFILSGYDYNVSVTVNVEAECVEVLWGSGANSEKKLILKKRNSYAKTNGSVSTYGAIIPASKFKDANELKYRFVCDGVVSDEYCVQVANAGEMPPLVVTELYGRPKGNNITVFFEVMNPSPEAVDLYDYKLMAYAGAEPTPDKYVCELALANEPSTQVIASCEVAVIWPILPQHHALQDDKFLTIDGFVEACMADFPKPGFDLAAEIDTVRIIPVEASAYDEITEKHVAIGKVDKMPLKTECTTLVIAPRDADAQNALENYVFKMVYNKSDKGDRDTCVRHSSLWTIDVRNPSEGVSLRHRAHMTPGRLDRGQVVPDLTYPYPVIVPIDADAGVRYTEDGAEIEFVIEAGRIADAYIYLKMPNGKYAKYYAIDDNNGVWKVKLSCNDIYKMSKLQYVIIAHDGVRAVRLGEMSKPIRTSLIDGCGPHIIDISPTEKYCYDVSRTPEMYVKYFDISGVDVKQCILCVDKKDITSSAHWSNTSVRYKCSKPLKYGDHSLEIMLKDKLGNKTYRKITFAICKPNEMNFYRGEVHAHTADSDGIAGPEQAYEYARDVGGADFFAVTDHSHYLTQELYDQQIIKANAYDDPGKFVTLYGYEMTWNNGCALWGHANILNVDWLIDDIKGFGLPEVFDRLKQDSRAVAMFNHPGLGWGNFHDYAHYSVEADNVMCLTEIKGAGYDREYANMLSLGWHASPAFNEDNHNYNWTTATPSTTYVLAPALTRENILDAFRRRRTYSTTDPTMKIKFKINDAWMGSRLQAPSILKVDIDISTESECGIGTIALVSEDNAVIKSINVGALQKYRCSFNVKPDFDYYYLRITSAGKYTVTAPVWVEGRCAVSIKKLDYKISESDYKPNSVIAKIQNVTDDDISNMVIDFYLTNNSGVNLDNAVPYRTVKLDNLSVGKTAGIQCNLPNVPGMRRVTAVVRGQYNGERYGDMATVQISPVKIAEISPASENYCDREGNVVANPFPYFKLCNMSNRDISLDGYYTRLWTATGKAPTEDKVLRLDGYTIKARGSLIVWVKPNDCDLTVEDFNKHYGVTLQENSDVVVTTVPAISSAKETRRLELMFEKETLARTEYNFKQQPGADINLGKAITYDVNPTLTGTSPMISNMADPDL